MFLNSTAELPLSAQSCSTVIKRRRDRLVHAVVKRDTETERERKRRAALLTLQAETPHYRHDMVSYYINTKVKHCRATAANQPSRSLIIHPDANAAGQKMSSFLI